MEKCTKIKIRNLSAVYLILKLRHVSTNLPFLNGRGTIERIEWNVFLQKRRIINLGEKLIVKTNAHSFPFSKSVKAERT